MFNADAVVIKQPLNGISSLKFVGSRLITKGRYFSAWSVPQLDEGWRIGKSFDPLAIPTTDGLLLSRWRHEYQIVDLANGEIVGACSVPEELTSREGKYALSACGHFIISGELGAIRVREVGTGNVVWERKLERAELRGIWPLRNGTQWAFCVNPMFQGNETPPTRVEVWDWPFGSQPRSTLERNVPFNSTVSDSGLIAFPGYGSKHITIFNLESGRLVREFPAPAGNSNSGYAHWLPGDRLALAWDGTLFIATIKELLQREFHLPTYSCYSVAATDEFLALVYHHGFVLVPFDRLPESEVTIEISPPWQDLPKTRNDHAAHHFVTPMPEASRALAGETTEGLRNELKEFERMAWIPRVRFRVGDVTSSKLGGTPWLSESEEWPCCGVCSQPMELFLQLNSDELPRELADRFSGLLQVFLCVTYGYSTGTCGLGYEGFSKASMLRLCKPVGPGRYRQPPFKDAFIEGVIESWRPRVDLPPIQELEALGIELGDEQETLMIDDSEQFTASGDKLGGWPDWPQNLDYMACPRCQGRMDVIFQIDSYDTLPHCFMDAGTAWVSQCKEHPDVLALNWNS